MGRTELKTSEQPTDRDSQILKDTLYKRMTDKATAIASRKKILSEKLPEILKKFENLSTFEELVEQCGKTAKEHGFWDAHLNDALSKVGIEQGTFADWFAANVADHPSYLSDKTDPEQIKDFEAAYERGRKLSEIVRTQCNVIYTLVFHQIVGDPFVFLGLMCTEVCEAMESCRKGNWEDPDGVFEELADVVIRIFDFVARFSGHTIGSRTDAAENFLTIIKAKMAVNECRPYLHGKKF